MKMRIGALPLLFPIANTLAQDYEREKHRADEVVPGIVGKEGELARATDGWLATALR